MPQTQRPNTGRELLFAQVETLSRQFIARFYQHDSVWCLASCTSDVTYLGSMRESYASGVEALRTLMDSLRASYRTCLAVATETYVRPLSDDCILTLARFFVITDPSLGNVRARKRRATLVWTLIDGQPRLRHLHVSIPLQANSRYRAVPAADDTDASSFYPQGLLEQVARRPGIILRDTKGTTHLVTPFEVRYIEAARQRSVVHCLERDIVVRRGIGDVVKELGPSILQVHRSFALNPAYVSSIGPRTVILDDGTHIPLPQRQAHALRQKLEKIAMDNETASDIWETPQQQEVQDEADAAVRTSFGAVDDARW